ncbi:MAG: EAL domain-containing protein [Pseudomonadales bacterium]|nr:EAL domain-containing protein [Pseudomonadales bacterium]
MHNTLQLLLLNQSEHKLDDLIQLIRDAGQAVYVHTIHDIEELEEKLEQQTWDLCCTITHHESTIAPATLCQHIKKLVIDLPVVLLYSEPLEANASDPVENAFKLGCADAAPINAHHRIQSIFKREFENLKYRRRQLTAQSKLDEAEQRCKLLLESSADGIAYIHEGMHIYANQTYLSLFGYPTMDELEAAPIMDLVGRSSRDLFKRQLKAMGAGNHETVEFNLCAKRADGEEFESPVSLSPARYDGENCLQIILSAPAAKEAEALILEGAPQQQPIGPINTEKPSGYTFTRNEFLHLLNARITSSSQDKQMAALSYLSIENTDELVESVGLLGYDQLIEQMTRFLASQLKQDEYPLSYLKDNVFAILSASPTREELQTWSENLCTLLHDRIFEVNEKSLRVIVYLGLSRIDDPKSTIESVLQYAEHANYTAHDHEQCNGSVFIHETDESADRSAAIAQLDDFKDAMTHQALFLMYEPVIGLRGIGGELYELHTGILDSEGQEVFGDALNTLAEEAGWGGKFDRWNILNGIKALAAHISKGHDTALFIHLSHHSLCDDSLVQWISVALKAADIPTNSIIFQITEADAASYQKQTKAFIEAITQIHCRAAISHFGMARDSLRTLEHLAADYIVMDKKFVEDYDDSKEQFAQLVGALQAQGKLIMVPSINSPVVVSKLWQLGINYIQGAYLQEPHSKMDYEFDLEAAG